MALLRLENVTVQYPIYNARSQSLRHQIASIGTGGWLGRGTRNIVTVTALSNVDLELRDGDRVGLIGHNGAGKSTLLRTLAGIYEPVSGTVTREGRTATIMEIGAGMDSELSGYENIWRMGMLLGLSRQEIEETVPDVEEFTELGGFLHLPVRTYSTGMMTRLMFAVATSSKPEILLVDEMFGTGDSEFQQKAQKRIVDLINSASIFVFASHSPDLIAKYCTRSLKLERGSLVSAEEPGRPAP